jgi:hypothetical protein
MHLSQSCAIVGNIRLHPPVHVSFMFTRKFNVVFSGSAGIQLSSFFRVHRFVFFFVLHFLDYLGGSSYLCVVLSFSPVVFHFSFDF